PLGVTATNGRTVIIAASREAKKRGVKSPSRTFEALQICPEMQFTGAHFREYSEISKKFIKICTQYSPFVEVFSMDELFMDITQTVKLFGGIDQLIRTLKSQIQQEIGEYITVSIGISHNKILAKLASGMNKPDGTYRITKENLDDVYKKVELTDICGIGPRIEKRLNSMGVYHLLSLRHLHFSQLVSEFGPVEAAFLQHVAWGDDETPVVHFGNAPQAKSVGRNYSLPHNEYDQRVILQHMYELCEEVSLKLRRLNKKAKTVGMSLRGDISFSGYSHLPVYSFLGRDLFEGCLRLYKKWEWGENEYMLRQISLWAQNLSWEEALPLSLFDIGSKRETIQQTVDKLNDRFGDHTIRNGFLLYGAKLTTVPNGFGADRLERKEIAKLY
ncbi:MAG TPA: hypothetical protein VFQ63_01450, partial [Patescibacteria group bacterium]|nr:hypothetical protein [Patescibacteria group bacterium]